MQCEKNTSNDPIAARHPAGFSLIELAMVVLIMGMIVAISVPAYRSFRETSSLKSAKENILAELKLAREKAIATRVQQEIRFMAGFAGADYHIWSGSVANPKWSLPEGITYHWGSGTQSSFRMQPSGRCLDSGMIIVQDPHGNRDTVSVQTSGFIIGK